MCDLNGDILFCTCEEVVENSTTKLYWKLVRVNENKMEDWMDAITGRCLVPSKNINEINDELIENKLNNSHCFDFDYQPKENDFLIVTEKLIETENYTHPYIYICFSYSENKWNINYFSDIDIEIEEIKGGEIKVIAPNQVGNP